MGNGQDHRRPRFQGMTEQGVVGGGFGKEDIKPDGLGLAKMTKQFGMKTTGKGPGPQLPQAGLVDSDEDDSLIRGAGATQPKEQIKAVIAEPRQQAAEVEQADEHQAGSGGGQPFGHVRRTSGFRAG